MKIPFIQHTGIGIHITSNAIRWVELSRIGNTLKVQAVDVEEVKSGDLESSLKALAGRQNPSFPYVTVNIDNAQVKQQIIEVPQFDDEEYLEHWLEEQVDGLIPEGLSRDEFVSRYHMLGEDVEEQFCLFVITRKQLIESRKELLESVGLKPVVITTGHLQAGYSLIFDEAFTNVQVRLLSIFEDGSSLQFYNEGILKNYIDLPGSGASATEIMEEATTYLVTQGADAGDLQDQNFYLACSDYFHEGDKARHPVLDYSMDNNIRLARPLSQVIRDEDGFSSDFCIPAGMAVRQLYPALDTINLLPPKNQELIKNEIQKKDALDIGILFGGTAILLLLIIMVIQLVLSSRLEETGRQVTRLQDKINTVQVATEDVRELKQKINQASQLVGERTSMAQTLELVGKSLPDRVWFNEVNIDKSSIAKEVMLYGFAYNDALVASLMERLENEKSTENVRLIFSEATDSEEFYSNPLFERSTLVRFEVRLIINPD